MAISDTTFPAILAALAATLDTADGVTVFDHEPREFSTLPAATILMQEAQRVEVALGEVRRESQIGSVDLLCAWTVRLWSQGDYTQASEVAALQALGALVGAIDADETLGGVVESATVSSASRERVESPPESTREFVTYVVTVTTSSRH